MEALGIQGNPQVVNVHVEELDLLKETGLGVLEVQGREPVGAQVGPGHGSGAAGLAQGLASRIEAEVAGSHDGVDVRRGTARGNNGVGTASRQGASAIVTQDGEGPFILCRSNGGDQDRQDGSEEHFVNFCFSLSLREDMGLCKSVRREVL